jgi:hypothetical protein
VKREKGRENREKRRVSREKERKGGKAEEMAPCEPVVDPNHRVEVWTSRAYRSDRTYNPDCINVNGEKVHACMCMCMYVHVYVYVYVYVYVNR